MISDLLQPECVASNVSVTDWKDAITKGVALLIANGNVTSEYEAAIFRSFEKFGSYMVIAPGIVLSHARPEDGVTTAGLSVINLATPTNFNHETNDPVSLVITLAAADDESHLETLRAITGLLMDDTTKNTLMTTTSDSELYQVLTA